MYIPEHFEISDKQDIHSFIESNAFGQMISHVDGKLFSSHLPLLLSDDKTKLYGHLARQNPQHTKLEGQEILITLQGPHDYVSPSWYTSPGVPTWNYQAVHIYGQATLISDPLALKHIVDQLTLRYEADKDSPWEPDYNKRMLQAIVGFQVHITDIQCKYKLSQNRPIKDQQQVIKQLNAQGSHELAQAMAVIVNHEGTSP